LSLVFSPAMIFLLEANSCEAIDPKIRTDQTFGRD
jgi:hypothetical protein